MATSIRKIQNSTWIDEIGLSLGLPRVPSESIQDYRIRLLKHRTNFPSPIQRNYIASAGRYVPSTEIQILSIEPLTTLGVEGIPQLVAPDPYIEIDSSFLRVYPDYVSDPTAPDLELNIRDRDAYYFLKDVYEELSTLSYLEVTPLSDPDGSDWAYLKSSNLMYSNNLRFVFDAPLGAIRMNELPNTYLREVLFGNKIFFKREINSVTPLKNGTALDGDYYVDHVNGIIFTVGILQSSCSYSYLEFPFKVMWQSVRAYPANDKSIDYVLKDVLVDRDGDLERLLLNSDGAKIINDILAVHPLSWGR